MGWSMEKRSKVEYFASCIFLPAPFCLLMFFSFWGGVGRKLIVIYIQTTLKVICKQMNILYSDKT